MGWRCGACHAATADAPSFGSRGECSRPVPSVRPVRLRRGIDEWWPTAEAGAAGACGWEKERDTNQSYRHRMHIMCWGAPPRRRYLHVPGSLENSWREFVWSQALAGGPQADKQARKASFSLHASMHSSPVKLTSLSLFHFNQFINILVFVSKFMRHGRS